MVTVVACVAVLALAAVAVASLSLLRASPRPLTLRSDDLAVFIAPAGTDAAACQSLAAYWRDQYPDYPVAVVAGDLELQRLRRRRFRP